MKLRDAADCSVVASVGRRPKKEAVYVNVSLIHFAVPINKNCNFRDSKRMRGASPVAQW